MPKHYHHLTQDQRCQVYALNKRDFAIFLGRSPDQAEIEDLRRYQLHMRFKKSRCEYWPQQSPRWRAHTTAFELRCHPQSGLG
jgi:hypothetical protein